MIHFYYGDGKGKTTAVMGLALRALGSGMPVTVIQFLKDGASGECGSLAKLGAKIVAGKAAPGFVFSMTEAGKAATRKLHDEHLQAAQAALEEGGLLVLDEVGDALSMGMVDGDKLLALLDRKGETEIAMTGHQPLDALMDRADYITEMKARRHPYEKGVQARPGIEF